MRNLTSINFIAIDEKLTRIHDSHECLSAHISIGTSTSTWYWYQYLGYLVLVLVHISNM